jgi:Transglycosylase
MKTTKQKIFLFLKIATLTTVTLVGTFYYFREDILRKVIEKVSTKLVTEYDCTINIKDAKFDGLSAVSLTEVSLVPKNADTLAKFQSIKTSINFWGLLKGDIQLGSLDAKKGYIHLIKKGETSNYAAFFANKSKDTVTTIKKNYAALVYRIIDKVSNFVPTDLDLQDFEFVFVDNGEIASLTTDQLLLDDEDLETIIEIKSKNFFQKLRIYGTADPRNKEADVQFVNSDKTKLIVPFVAQKYGLKSSFDSIRVSVDDIEMTGEELHVDGFASITNLAVKHPKISKNEVLFENLKMDYKILSGANFIALDEGSTAEVNKIKIEPYLKYEKTNSKIYTLKVRIPNMKAQDFITSLPDGLFTNFKGMEVAGSFSYSMSFKIDKRRPWNLRFNSNINKNGLKITKYGKADIGKLNGEFEYAAIINDKPQRPVFVGVANPDYYPLTEISPFLKKAVITFEDPNYYSHKGFEMNAFRASMVKNMATNRFERGGSTISMQLIKNAFLKREKTISRKLEEILLCYVMENNKIVSKDRILEVYFNVIEWGPNVYGIGEASRFYFQKKPADLTLNECMFLASIVPMPQKFMNQFEGPIWKNKFARRSIFMKNLMIKRGLITPEEMDSSSYVNINGAARSYLDYGLSTQPTPKDSTGIEEFEF